MRPSTIITIGLRAAETWLRKWLHLPVRPYKWLLELTLECNSRCVSCSIWKTRARIKRQQLSLLEIEALFAQNGHDLAWLALSGGEITRYDQFATVLELAKRFCQNLRLVTFTTNGLLPHKALEYAQAVRTAGFDSFITISLDGDEETHDRLRGVQGNHRSAWQTYHLLRSHGIGVHFGITLSSANVGFVERRYGELRTAIRAVTIEHEQGIYAQANNIDDTAIARSLLVIDGAYRPSTLGEWIEKCYVALGREFVRRQRSTNVIPCAAGRAALHIRPDGTTLACMFLQPLGNVRHGTTLRALINSKAGSKLLAQVDSGQCPHCWMNCYAPHSILLSPFASAIQWMRTRHSKDSTSCRPRVAAHHEPPRHDARVHPRHEVPASRRVLPVLDCNHDRH